MSTDIFVSSLEPNAMTGDKQLDVREIDKQSRKKVILNLFDELHDEQKLELISDHSLSPLHKLFQKERHGFFKWEEECRQEDLWTTSIIKTDSLNLTINEILKHFPFAIEVLERHGIPYFKYGNNRLSETSPEAQAIYDEIRRTQRLHINPLRTEKWSIGFTVDYIINNHHTYVKDIMPELESLIDHLVSAHAATHPQLPMIKERFIEFKEELIDHMNDEENTVFPSFKRLESTVNANEGEVANEYDDTINWMEEDHILTGTTLRSMRNFCNNYVAPVDSSPGFKILFEELRKFEMDMHFHMHLENNILFAKVSDALGIQKK